MNNENQMWSTEDIWNFLWACLATCIGYFGSLILVFLLLTGLIYLISGGEWEVATAVGTTWFYFSLFCSPIMLPVVLLLGGLEWRARRQFFFPVFIGFFTPPALIPIAVLGFTFSLMVPENWFSQSSDVGYYVLFAIIAIIAPLIGRYITYILMAPPVTR